MGAPSVSYKKRLLASLVIISLIFAVLIGRLFYIQVIEGDELQERALYQWTRDTSLSAARGNIQDATGVVLAQSGTAYKVVIWPKSIDSDERIRVATELSELLGMTYEYVLERVADTSKQEIVLARRVEREVVDQIAARKLGMGVGTAIDTKRYYPSGSLFSQLLGFTTVDGVGQSGLEQRYDKYLAGENGRMITETDRDGNALAYGIQEVIEPTDGYNLVLTVNSVYQSALEKACAEALEVNNAKTAQGILMNCRTGGILAITSQPDYDPNDPPRNDAELLAAVTRNRIVADAYEPGSTFKLVTLAAALDSHAIDPAAFGINCPGYHIVNGERIKCWKAGGHGQQNLYEAAQNSCNPAFMAMAQAMGVETFYEYIYAFGFGSSTGSNVPGEASGIVTHQKYITENTLARIGFGQSIAMTPLQLATAVSAAVNGGNLMQPYVLDRIVANDGTVILQNEPTVVRRVIDAETSALVREIAESVVTDGSGRNAAVAGYRIGGKTGTAQKYENGKIADGKLIASFIGFAPADDPEFVCLILVDEPQVGTIFGSTVAAPFVKQMLEETLRHAGYLPEGSEEPVAVPDLSGMTIAEAEAALDAVGLTATYQDDTTLAVTAQVPIAGQTVVTGSGVLLYTDSTGVETGGEDTAPEDMVTVPDVLGMDRLEASDALRERGLTILIYPEDQAGDAIRQYPEAGASVEAGTEVLVEFSDTDIGE